MIVRRIDDRLQLITQPDHAQLAGRIMAGCGPLRTHPRRGSILRAVAEHDNGWAEEDANPVVNAETGEIVDFIQASAAARQRVWPRGVGRLFDDPWAAALVAQHATTVYDRFRGDPAWKAFFEEMTVLRDDHLERSGRSLEELTEDYGFVRLGDLISLAFCGGWSEEHRFGEWTVKGSGDTVLVQPDPFGDAMPIEIIAREIPARAFRSDQDLRDALTAAIRIPRSGEVKTA